MKKEYNLCCLGSFKDAGRVQAELCSELHAVKHWRASVPAVQGSWGECGDYGAPSHGASRAPGPSAETRQSCAAGITGHQ